ncbi:hypothetical protein HYQ46_012194 [Verticillium longisporum]|nr:hypothetical protein HYQ46_012194 [Verticillium longisporum]
MLLSLSSPWNLLPVPSKHKTSFLNVRHAQRWIVGGLTLNNFRSEQTWLPKAIFLASAGSASSQPARRASAL